MKRVVGGARVDGEGVMKTWGVNCAVKWCVCLVNPESQYCAVHAKRGSGFRVEDAPKKPEQCTDCYGSGDCSDCDGEGDHYCERGNCNDRHECGTCDGTGACQSCKRAKAKKPTYDQRYVEFAFDAGWVPPVIVTYPWDVEA